MRLPYLLFFALLASNSYAATLTARVVGITDGDTIVVIDADRARHKVRLAAVDAPEPKQAFGTRAKQNLSDMVFGKDVSIEWKKRDRNERIVGKVWVQPSDCPTCGKTLDAGQAQIIAGLAWWYQINDRLSKDFLFSDEDTPVTSITVTLGLKKPITVKRSQSDVFDPDLGFTVSNQFLCSASQLIAKSMSDQVATTTI